MTTTTTDNLFLRDNLDGDGTLPQSGDLYKSPDIIPAGLVAVANAQQVYSQQDSYETDPGVNLVIGDKNYLYVRAKNNYGGGAAEGTVNLYAALTSLTLTPDQWDLIGSDAPISATSTGEIVVAGGDFEWTPPQPPSGVHYCLIAQLVTTTPDDPNPIPAHFDSSADFSNWKANNAQVAQRNIQLASTSTGSLAYSYVFSNLDQQAEPYVFAVSCNDFPTGIPVGLTCADVGLDVSGTTDGTSPWPLNSDPLVVEAGYTGKMTVSMDFTGVTIPDGASYSVNYYRSNADTKLFTSGTVEPRDVGLVLPESAGRLALIGSCYVVFRDDSG